MMKIAERGGANGVLKTDNEAKEMKRDSKRQVQ